VKERYQLPSRYILNVGTVEERKNVLLAVKALPQLPNDVQLVIVGRRTRYADSVWEWATRHGVSDRVMFLEGVPNSDLPAIYRSAAAFVYPSRYEGFGIPVIEAIQSGLPVVAATGSCLEEAGGPDSYYVNPDDSDAMAATLNDILSTDQQERIARSQEYVKQFENANVAQQILKEYDLLLGR
jgi:glycosyltransferase involved in cell wall biosynthesis